MDRKSEIDAINPIGKKIHIEGKIELKDVVFYYPTRTEQKILNGINISIPAG